MGVRSRPLPISPSPHLPIARPCPPCRCPSRSDAGPTQRSHWVRRPRLRPGGGSGISHLSVTDPAKPAANQQPVPYVLDPNARERRRARQRRKWEHLIERMSSDEAPLAKTQIGRASCRERG